MRGRALAIGLAAALIAGRLPAQQPPPAPPNPPSLEEGRKRIEEIRAERERLQQQQQRLEGQLSDVGTELRNIERQRDVTNRLVNEIDRQINTLGSQLERTSAELLLTQDNLVERRAVLERRLVDIYKRGPLHTFQVLLSAESFGDLLTRYKYLFLTSRQDRELLSDIERLGNRIERQRTGFITVRDQLDRRKEERESELKRFSSLAAERTRRMQGLRQSSREAASRLTQLERDEARLNEILASLERNRRTGGDRPLPPGSGLTTEDIGKLDWPVDGRIVFQFGRETLPGGGTIRWNGIGIGAALGTPVRAVASGRIAVVQHLNTYGLTVMLEHGNGYYSLYMQLATASVQAGDAIQKGQTIGTVGGQNTDKGPHLHFEIRGKDQIALDPADWLRRRQ